MAGGLRARRDRAVERRGVTRDEAIGFVTRLAVDAGVPAALDAVAAAREVFTAE